VARLIFTCRLVSAGTSASVRGGRKPKPERLFRRFEHSRPAAIRQETGRDSI
jgi:hypothetical protein